MMRKEKRWPTGNGFFDLFELGHGKLTGISGRGNI